MADTPISGLNAISGAAATAADEFAVVNAAETKKISLAELKTALTKDGLGVTGDLTASGTRVSFPNLPTAVTGLTAGDLWNDGGTLKIAP